MKAPFPLEGGSYRVVDGALVRDGDVREAVRPAAAQPTPEPDTGDAAATRAETPVSRRRGKHSEE